MKLSKTVKPISYLKTHASKIVRDMSVKQAPVIITLHGEARAVLQDIREYEKDRETMSMLKILALSQKNLEGGKVKPAKEAFLSVRKKAREISGR